MKVRIDAWRGPVSVGCFLAASLLLLAGSANAASFANLGPHYDATTNPCKICHDTASASPAIRGWAGSTATSGSGWSAKSLSYLCYMCHQSAPVLAGTHNATNTAYAATSHGFLISRAPDAPEGTTESAGAFISDSGLPYAKTAGLECTSCHNVHVATARPFLNRANVQALCNTCHPGRVNNASAGSVTGLLGHGGSWSTHPTTRTVVDTGAVNIKAVIAAEMSYAVPAAGSWTWRVGGHNATGTQGSPGHGVDCWTCHAVHGRDDAGVAAPAGNHYLAIENNTNLGVSGSALCEGCHFGGAAGEQVGTLAVVSPLYSDHPIDSLANRTFYPTGTSLPVAWTQAQPFFNAGAFSPVCSSCHDVHGGIAGTPLLQWPQAAADNTFSYGVWCFACHAAAQLSPPGHHSTKGNIALADGDPIDSQLTCGSCHGPAGGLNWTAHNGFWTWATAPAQNDSAFCLGCHLASDPTDLASPALKGLVFAEPAPYPAGHGTSRGSASHYLGPDSGEFDGVDPKLTAWSSSGYFSAYGPPNTGGGGIVKADLAGAIICGSCHNILYNDGRANPASYPPSSALKAGWRSNLLLEPYKDDSPGLGDGTGATAVGSALCTGCHTKVGNHHPLTGDVVPLSGLLLRTGAGSFADAAGAPNTLSYPGPNKMDCDSCHRPHQADTDSDVVGPAHGSGVSTDGRPTRHILEVDGPGHRYSDLCAECHAR